MNFLYPRGFELRRDARVKMDSERGATGPGAYRFRVQVKGTWREGPELYLRERPAAADEPVTA